MDIFCEQIVKRPADGKVWTVRVLIGLGMGVLAAVSVFIFLFVFPILGAALLFGVIWGGFRLITNSDCEYEYIVTNGEIDIDKIIAQRKRVRLITAKASTFEAFGEYTDSTPDTDSDVTVVNAVGESESENATKTYYADFKHASAGNVRLIFSPEERVIEAILPFLSTQLKYAMRKNNNSN
ncbi:MAG: hypothetical protein NC253_04415 [Ruminococcus sp.]|nr:hypothetical protein [Ruminococcus sp.]MCM1382610.1 hypothetical protein [Muribaculaceae bacterium]MCM1480540.1 hypothetical protein [Muribaculaceae bacterium]